jgi:hypothetical protein
VLKSPVNGNTEKLFGLFLFKGRHLLLEDLTMESALSFML